MLAHTNVKLFFRLITKFLQTFFFRCEDRQLFLITQRSRLSHRRVNMFKWNAMHQDIQRPPSSGDVKTMHSCQQVEVHGMATSWKSQLCVKKIVELTIVSQTTEYRVVIVEISIWKLNSHRWSPFHAQDWAKHFSTIWILNVTSKLIRHQVKLTFENFKWTNILTISNYFFAAIIWVKDEIILSNNQHYSISHFATADEFTDSTLRVITIEKRQYGDYKCKAVNKLGQDEAKINLFETVIPVCPPVSHDRWENKVLDF